MFPAPDMTVEACREDAGSPPEYIVGDNARERTTSGWERVRYVTARVLVVLVVSALPVYWFATLMYCLPNNPVRIELDRLVVFYDQFLYQKWNFFAPPPKTETRLYFGYLEPHSAKVHTFEVLTKIRNGKQAKAPFNFQERVLDYVVGGAADNITEMLVTQFEYNDILIERVVKEGEIPSTEQETLGREHAVRAIFPPYDEANSSLRTLLSYSRLVAIRNLPAKKDLKVQIWATKLDIPKFRNRADILKTDLQREEKLTYRSPWYDLTTIKE